MSAEQRKVFGIGLARTGTHSLSSALARLGVQTRHYPIDMKTFEELIRGEYRLSILDECDGVTDITVAPFYAQLDQVYPGSKFILTVREKSAWLASVKRHVDGRPPFPVGRKNTESETMRLKRFLRAAVFGCYYFQEDRFSYVYDLHRRNVEEYFKDRPESLLILDICGGEGWEKLCPFLGKPTPDPPEPFPKASGNDDARQPVRKWMRRFWR